MPLTVIDATQHQEGLASLEPEFMTLLEDKKVSVSARAVLGHLGVTRMQTYANLEADELKLRQMLASDLGLDSAEGMKVRIEISALIEAWKSARQRVQVADEAAAEARAHGRPREVLATQALSIRRAHALSFGKLEDHEFPCRDYLSWRFSQFEEHEFRAEHLTEVVSAEAAGDDRGDSPFTMHFTATGKISGVRQRVKIDPPKSPEQLRRAYRLMAVHWEVMRQSYPDRPFLARSSSDTWSHLVTYLLGPKVADYRTRHGVGLSWEGLLEYEYQIRKNAMTLITEQGRGLDEALRESWTDGTLENRYFTLELVTAGERQSSKGQSKGDGAGGVKRALEKELAEVKKLRAQLSQTLGNGGGGGGTSSGGGGGGASAGSARSGGGGGGDPNKPSIFKHLNDLKKTESFIYRAKGSKQSICTFFQISACKHGTACKFDHICLRCHLPGHTCLDSVCKGTRKLKNAK